MRNYTHMFVTLVTALVFTACVSDSAPKEFDRSVLDRARKILDSGPDSRQAASFLTVEGFNLQPSGIKSPQAWALFEVRVHGDAMDAARCYPYLRNGNSEVRREAEKSFVLLSRSIEKKELADLLESREELVRNLVLVYAGLDWIKLSSQDLRALSKNADPRVQKLARTVLDKREQIRR